MLKAADKLALTQPAVSKTIAELEELVGRPLLVRHARGVKLTPAGEMLMRYAGATLRTLREGLDAVMGQPHVHQESIAVGALPNVAATLLPAAVETLRHAFPSIRVQVASGTNAVLMGRLRQGDLDFVFGRLAEPSDLMDLSFEHIYSEGLVAVARSGHPLARARQVQATDLSDYTLVLPPSGTTIRRVIDAFLVTHRVGLPGCVVETLESMFALQLVLRSDAVWMVPAGVVAGFRPIELARLRVDTADTVGPVGITTRAGATLSAGAHALLEALRAEATRYGVRSSRTRARLSLVSNRSVTTPSK